MDEVQYWEAKAVEVKAYFSYDVLADFNRDWKALSTEDQKWFKTEVGKALKLT
jgi:hypothetical protein